VSGNEKLPAFSRRETVPDENRLSGRRKDEVGEPLRLGAGTLDHRQAVVGADRERFGNRDDSQ